jgi:hypothetical protein
MLKSKLQKRTAAGTPLTIPPANPPSPKIFCSRCEKKKAYAFFESLNKANLYAISYRLQTAKKPETRQKRMATILAMMAKAEKFH